MRLSSAERIAKEIKPTFIYVFRTEDCVTFEESFLIHLLDEPLATILKRLRVEEARGDYSAINKKDISMSPARHGIRIPPTGQALRAALEQACGRSLHAYTAPKKEQLQRRGFEPLPYKATLRFRQSQDLDELVDVFLGLKRQVEIDHLHGFEVRFGIPLSLRQFTPDTQLIDIDPYPVDSCTITVRNEKLPLPSVFKGEIFVPAIPNLPMRALKVLVRSQLFSLLMTPRGDVSFEFPADIRSQKRAPESWIDIARLLMGLAFGKAKIEIRPRELPTQWYSEISIEDPISDLDPIRCQGWLNLCERLSHLFKLAGVSPDVGVRIQDIEEKAEEILKASAGLTGQGVHLSFTTETPKGLDLNTPLRACFVSYVDVGDVLLAHYVVAELDPQAVGDHVVWRSVRIVPGSVRPLQKALSEFRAFVQFAWVEANVSVLLVPREPGFTSGTERAASPCAAASQNI